MKLMSTFVLMLKSPDTKEADNCKMDATRMQNGRCCPCAAYQGACPYTALPGKDAAVTLPARRTRGWACMNTAVRRILYVG